MQITYSLSCPLLIIATNRYLFCMIALSFGHTVGQNMWGDQRVGAGRQQLQDQELGKFMEVLDNM